MSGREVPTDRPTHRLTTPVALACESASLPPTTVEPNTARPTAARAAGLRSQLSDRDLSVLYSLHSDRLLTGAQVQRLHVADGSPGTQARRTRALLQRLAEFGLVVRLGRRVGGVHAGSAGFVYGISGLGQAVLGVDGLHGGRRRRVWDVKVAFQDHVLAVSELHVAVVEAQRSGVLELLTFQPEPHCWRRFPGPHGQPVILKPDAFVHLGVGDYELVTFVEVDMSTESAPTIARKCQVYAAYWRTGIEQARHELFPRVLWLANNQQSAQRITGVLARLPREIQPLFHVAFLSDAVTVLAATAGGPMA